MINQIELDNYKSYEHDTIILKPITLLCGGNSSGKTAILKSILLLKQSFEASGGNYLLINGPYTNNGLFSTIRRNIGTHADDKGMGISITFMIDKDMFAVKDVKRALRWIFSLYDDEDVSILLEDDDEDVLSALMPEELSRKYKREARNISMFWASRGPKDKGSWSGSKLFKKKAVVLCAINMDSHTTSNLRVESRSELWLLSNMRFAEVHCVRSIALRKNRPVSITECRTLVKYVKKSSDLFVDAYTLFCQLDDTGLFEKLLGDKNMLCDF